MSNSSTNQNPILRHSPADFYSGEALLAANAIRSGNLNTLTELLKRMPTVAASRGSNNLPLLAWAMGHNDFKSFKLLLEYGANPNDFIMIEDAKMSLVSVATGAESPQWLELLLTHKANPNGLPGTEPPLFTARYAHKPDRFERLLQAGADLNHPDDTGKTVIMVFVLANDYQQAIQLVKRGADVNVQMMNGTTIRKIIESYPLPLDTPQGRAQAEMALLLK